MANILIVDDSQSISLLMRAVLERAGHKVEVAGDGQAALARLGIEPAKGGSPLFDLVVLDVMLPLVDGFTIANRMKDDPRTARLPIIVITAKSDMRALFAPLPNVAAFFAKPFDPKEVRDTVAKIVS